MNTTSAAASALPDRFGKYTVLRHLASGGMADLFLSRASGIVGFEKIVVIKRIREDLAGDHEITELFLHEARLAATLEHPHIAQVYDVGIVNDSYFFAMEYVHGVDLRKIMRAAIQQRRSVPLDDAVQIGVGVCAALHYAHEKRDYQGRSLNIIHRDVSPSNVLVSYDGAVKVCDFGVAKATNRTQQTAHGVLKGKIAYMSPEQCRCEAIDRRSDIFAIAIVLYELTTLNKLFRGANDLEVMKNLTEGQVIRPSLVRPGYPPELERIILKGLEKDRDRRYATAQEMQLDLEAFARDQKLSLSSVSIARLMGQLFEGHVEAWQEALRDGQDLGQHLANRPPSLTPTPTPSSDLQVASAAGNDTNLAIGLSSRGRSATQRRAWSPPQLGAFGVAALALAAVGLFVGNGQAPDPAAAAGVQLEAEKLGALLESEARALHMRTDGIAMMPMVRAAIGTDANTMKDMASTELVFSPGRGEVVELFQTGSDRQTVSLLRLPAGGRALPRLRGRETRVELLGGKLVVTAAAPVMPLYRAHGAGGSVVLSEELDLAAAQRRLGPHVARAWLRAAGGDRAALVDGAGGLAGDALAVAVPVGGDLDVNELTLEAVPRATAAAWRQALRWGCWLLAGALVGLLAHALRRRRRG